MVGSGLVWGERLGAIGDALETIIRPIADI